MRLESIKTTALALIAGFLFAGILGGGRAQAALWCSQTDGHGFCLVCDFDDAQFSLAPGEAKQPLACDNMAADRRVSVVFGGLGTVVGTPPDDGLRSVIGLKVAGVPMIFHRRYASYGYRHAWGPNTPTMPVGPVTAGVGASGAGQTVAPVFSLSQCRSSDRVPHACDFTLSGRICVRGLC